MPDWEDEEDMIGVHAQRAGAGAAWGEGGIHMHVTMCSILVGKGEATTYWRQKCTKAHAHAHARTHTHAISPHSKIGRASNED